MNFPLILFIFLLVTGVITLLDRAYLKKRRAEGVAEPWWVEYSKSFFPVILLVFALRSFLVEPFKIPSSSMRPTLVVGDFILVNKYTYGIRLPILEKKIIPLGDPQRGDVVVFRYPLEPSLDYIKRVVGVPGDEVLYRDKQLFINGQKMELAADGSYSYLEGAMSFITTERFKETLSGVNHAIARSPEMPPVRLSGVRTFPGRENCDYNDQGFRCKVPAGHFFMMGDNRDNSEDSRYWGFVPDDHIRGRAFFIWFNWDDLSSFAFERMGQTVR